MSVVVIGVNNRTLPLDVFEQLTIAAADQPKALHDLMSRQNVLEAVVLSTCNRTEVCVYTERFHGAYGDVRDFLADTSHLPPEAFSDHLYTHYEPDNLYSHYEANAARHLFEVASGVDSAVLGETEILRQIKDAWELAHSEQATGSALNGLFQHAFEVGKRARTDTGISRHITSVAQAAIAMAAERLGSLDGKRVLIVGAGDMGEGSAVAAAAAGVSEVLIANRTWGNATEVAERIGAKPLRLSDLADTLVGVDVMVTGTGATSVIVEHTDLDAAMAARGGRPLLVIDIAMPRDVDPAAAEIDGLTLLDMDDLQEFANVGRRERQNELSSVQGIIDDELQKYVGRTTVREVEPLIAALWSQADKARRGEFDRFRTRLDRLDAEQLELVEAITKGLLGKILRSPTVRLKEAAGTAKGDRLAEALRELHDLDD
ncbi:MAG: glutamyl-tRNA reductase [Acidimicrobiales bacterium]